MKGRKKKGESGALRPRRPSQLPPLPRLRRRNPHKRFCRRKWEPRQNRRRRFLRQRKHHYLAQSRWNREKRETRRSYLSSRRIRGKWRTRLFSLRGGGGGHSL